MSCKDCRLGEELGMFRRCYLTNEFYLPEDSCEFDTSRESDMSMLAQSFTEGFNDGIVSAQRLIDSCLDELTNSDKREILLVLYESLELLKLKEEGR